MGFWDFIAPDFAGFKAAVEPYVPDVVVAGPLVLTRDTLIDLAYLNPASAAGLGARLFYQAGSVQGATQSNTTSLLQAQLDNLARGGQNPIVPAMAGSDLTEGVTVPQIVLANTYEATIKMVCGGRAVDNVLHFTGTGAGQEAACAAALQTNWVGAAKPFAYFDPKVQMVAFQVVDLSSTSGGIFTQINATLGPRAASSLSTRAACMLLQYNGQTRNRSSRGRTYFGPVYEGDIDVDGATLVPASLSAQVTVFNNFRTNMATAGFTQCVVSRKLVASYPITFFRIQPTIATQRRRLRK